MDATARILEDQPGPSTRALGALAPAFFACAYFLVGYVAYLVRCAARGAPRQWEREARGRTALVGMHLRLYFFWVTNPLWRLILASSVSANTVTALAAVLGGGAAVAAAAGRFALGGWLFLFAGILDVMDGRVARARGQVSAAGAAVDSVLDRYTDALMLVGLGIYYLGSWSVVAVLFALVGTSMTPYVRAKSEALGSPVAVGLMQRTERLVYLGAAVALSPVVEALRAPADPRPAHWLAAAGITFLALTSNVTALQRFILLVRAINRRATAVQARPAPPMQRDHAA